MLNKNFLRRSISVVLSLSISMSALTFSAFAQEKTATIQIVHTNDIHGYYTETENGTLGFSVLKEIIDNEGADLVLDVGDSFHGQAFATIEQGRSIAQLMKAAGYDAVTPGNHDWSYGAEQLKELEEIGGFKILASNVVKSDGTEFFDSDYLVKEVTADDGSKLKVGVVGVIDDAFYSSTPSENLEGLKFQEEAKEATETAEYLRNTEKCDIVIAITHQSDCEGFVSNIKGIDAVFAGHEHIVLDESYPDSEGKLVPVVEAGYYFYNIGVMDLTVDADTKQVTSIDETVYNIETLADKTGNESVKNEISQIENRQQSILSQTIGSASQAYPYSWEDIRISQQDIGKLVTESYIAQTGADIAFENAGGIRSGIDSGEITYQDIISISPYGNVLVTKKLTGKEIIEILNKSLSIGKECDAVYSIQKEAVLKGEDPYQYQWPDDSGSYIQFSGIEIETDQNNSIVSAKVGQTALDENKTYTVAINNYLSESEDYPALASAPLDKEYGTCEQALIAYISGTSASEENTESTENIENTEAVTEKLDDEEATRGEVAQMLIIAADDYNSGVEITDILKGYDDGQLHEEQPVTRAEALIMLKRAFGEIPVPTGTNAILAYPSEEFTDIPDWAKAELEDVFNAGIVAGTSEGTFSPDEHVTIGQMKLFISRMFTLYGSNIKDDFYSTANKEYLENCEIKPGRLISGLTYDLSDTVMEQTEDIINEVLSSPHEKGTPEQKIADLYETVMDMDGRNKAGYEPLKPYIDLIDSAENIDDLISMQSVLKEETGTYSFMDFFLSVDFTDSTKTNLFFSISTPDMDKAFYSNTDENTKQLYFDFITDRLALLGDKSNVTAEEIYEFDKQLADKQLSPEAQSDVDQINNAFTFDEIAALFPNVDMEKVLSATGLKKEDKIIIPDVEITKEYAKLFNDSNIDVLKAKAKLELFNDFCGYLSQDFIDLMNQFNSDFYGIDGSYTIEEMANLAVQNNLSQYVGKIYAEKYFSPEAKADVTKMVEDIIAVYKDRIKNLDWMSDETKEQALKKLDTMGIKVGYPDTWKSIVDDVEIKSVEEGGSYFSNKIALLKASKDNMVANQGKPIDKTQWATPVFTVNAFYTPSYNDITFPAAFLQKPIYDPEKSYEYNLGSVGITIAHEITHAFDNNGAKYDENGNAANWWTEEDYASFVELCIKMAELYDGYEYAPGIAINGTLTLSENVADQGALSCVLEIASKSEDPNYEELFYSLARMFSFATTREFAEYVSNNDVHSFGRTRINPLLSNSNEFYNTFGITEKDGMYISPEKRVKIW